MFLGHATPANLLKKINYGLAGRFIQINPVFDGWAQRELESSFRYEKRTRESWLE